MTERRSGCIDTGSRVRTSPSALSSLTVLVWLGALNPVGFAGCSFRSDLAAQVASARTPADHAAIAQELSAKAAEYGAAAAYHRGLAAKYQNLAQPGAEADYRIYDSSDIRMAEHCRKVAEDLERAASDITQLAHEHERLARELEGHKQ